MAPLALLTLLSLSDLRSDSPVSAVSPSLTLAVGTPPPFPAWLSLYQGTAESNLLYDELANFVDCKSQVPEARPPLLSASTSSAPGGGPGIQEGGSSSRSHSQPPWKLQAPGKHGFGRAQLPLATLSGSFDSGLGLGRA